MRSMVEGVRTVRSAEPSKAAQTPERTPSVRRVSAPATSPEPALRAWGRTYVFCG